MTYSFGPEEPDQRVIQALEANNFVSPSIAPPPPGYGAAPYPGYQAHQIPVNPSGLEVQPVRGSQFLLQQQPESEQVEEEGTDPVQILQFLQATTQDLSSQVHHVHVNLTCPAFVGMHKLLQKYYERLDDHADILAEESRKIGAFPKFQIRDIIQYSLIQGLSCGDMPWQVFLGQLIPRGEILSSNYLLACKAIEDQHPDISNIFQGFMTEIKTFTWKIRSHLV